MSFRRSIEQLRPARIQKVDYTERVMELLDEQRVDTTFNASVTELFPALAFNMNYRPSGIEDFKKFLYKLNLASGKAKNSFDRKDANAAKLVIDKLSSPPNEKLLKTKLENAIGITKYLFDLHVTKPIKNVVWGYRAKPPGIPKNHAGDIFVFFKDGTKIGVSLKAGTAKSKEPLKNTYVGTQYRALGVDTKNLEAALWNRVYSKIPGISNVATKSNFVKNKEVTKLYVDYYTKNQKAADELYREMLVVARQQFCKVLNKMSTKEFIKWTQETFNLQRKGETVPLVLVKAVGTNADEKSDDIVDMIPLVTKHHAYLNKSSVQEYLIDIFTPNDKKTLKMTIRSDSGVRPEKGTSGQGRLGQYLQLKMQYSGTIG
tara:strand:- start:231 stop:1352 length:1122 start_codon:yes stop_codon:yes gene_type:complete